MSSMMTVATDAKSFKYWWKEERDPHKSIVQAIKWLDNYQRLHSEMNRRHLILYGNRASLGLGSDHYTPAIATAPNRLTMNVIQSVIDAAVSQIATSKPRIMNLTEDGSWAQQNRAKKLDKWVQGIFYETGAYEVGRTVFRDACIFGTGTPKIVEESGRARMQRAIIDDILVDDRDARNGKPRQLFEVREVSREMLIEAFPKHKAEIQSAGNTMRQWRPIVTGMSDLVAVAEAFHLPSSEDAKDGRHVICLDNVTLVDEEWTKPYFPYPAMRWGISPLGWYGWGIAEQLTGIQVEINYLLQKIQRLMTIATSQLWVRKGSGIDKQKLNNEDWAVREYVTEPPIHLNVQSVSPEYFQHVQYLRSSAYEMAGVNMLTAQAQKPAGLNSGKALDSYQDTQSQRFLEVSQRYEEMYVHAADMLCDLARDIAERDGEYKVKARDRSTFEMLDWDDVKHDRGEYVTQPYPTNFFPQTPSGQWAQIERMIGSNFLTQDEAAELLDYPDLSAVTSLRNAPLEFVRRVLGDILDKGIYRAPEPYTPIEIAMRLTPLEILKAEQNNAPDDRIDLLRQYMNDLMALQQQMAPPPVAPQMPVAPQQGIANPQLPGEAPQPTAQDFQALMNGLGGTNV